MHARAGLLAPALRPPVPQPSPGHRLRRRDGRGAHRSVHRTGDVALAHRTGRGSLLRRRRHAQAGGWPAHRAAGTGRADRLFLALPVFVAAAATAR
ncbi:hypothetical protein ACR6C2_20415 [Streptomyces sp. INA 01156]